MPITGADKKELQQLDVEAKKFFESFSKALEKQDATEAAMHIAPNIANDSARDKGCGVSS